MQTASNLPAIIPGETIRVYTPSTSLALIPGEGPRYAAHAPEPIVDRETWLRAFAAIADKYIVPTIGHLPPTYRVTCSWAFTRGRHPERIMGQCFAPHASTSGAIEIFISPTDDNPRTVASTLVHELVHAYVGVDKGHGPVFQKAAAALGFTAPWTSTPETDELWAWVDVILDILPPYPHAAMDVRALAEGILCPDSPNGAPVPMWTLGPGHGPGMGSKPQGTRMHKAHCAECGYTVRVSSLWLAKGTPSCVCGAGPMVCR